MFKLMLTGKATNWVNLPEIEGNPITAQFTLKTKSWVKGAMLERNFKVFVPKHKHAWTAKRVGDGKFTVLVEADDIAVSSDLEHSFAIKLVDIHDL